MADAPQGDITAGALISMFNACLVDGFNTKIVSSITQSSGTATLVTGSSHNYDLHSVLEITGANESQYNGEFRVTNVVDANTLEFTIDAGAPASATTGSVITAKVAPLGWSKAFEDIPNNKVVYQSLNPQASGYYFRLEDSGTVTGYEAPIQGYRTMSDIDTGVDPIFTRANHWIKKWNNSGNSWYFFGDDKTFYYGVARSSSAAVRPVPLGFGDYESFGSVDPFPCIMGSSDSASNSDDGNTFFIENVNDDDWRFAADKNNEPTNPATIFHAGYRQASHSGTVTSGLAYPSYSGGHVVSPIYMRDGTTLKGVLRGIYYVQTNTLSLANQDSLNFVPFNLDDGELVMPVMMQLNTSTSTVAMVFVSLDDWA